MTLHDDTIALRHMRDHVAEALDLATHRKRDDLWRQIIGMRHRLVHGYDAVDYAILWRIVESELPGLLVQVESMLSEMASSSSGG